MTPLASDGGGQPLPTCLRQAINLSHDYKTTSVAKDTIETQMIDSLVVCRQQLGSDFTVRAFCERDDVALYHEHTTIGPMVSKLSKFDRSRRLEIDPDFRMPMSGWDALYQLVNKGLPFDVAFDLAEEFLEVEEIGVYNELSLIPATIANMKRRGELLLEAFNNGENVDIQRAVYPKPENYYTGAFLKRWLGDVGMQDFSGLRDDGWYQIDNGFVIVEKVERDE